ncbi:RNA polymerase sigma factor [Agathobacter rectalis]|uniref:RNA polymerase sigma factor n=1 Tax=Agathobacter rectalis TaxID=39491 RepID=UPI003F5ED6DF
MKKTKSYLYSIAGNIIKNNYKKKKEIMTDQLPDIEDENPKNIEIRIDIERALEQLPEEIKEIVILFFFQELKQKEIADLLNIKLSLVKYRVSKAKELLAKQLEVEKL